MATDPSDATRPHTDRLVLIAAGVAFGAVAVVLVWTLYLVRSALVLVYVSMLLAIGFSPLVHAIEHQRLVPIGTPRLPRAVAILVVYLTFVAALTAAGMLVIPPLVTQASELWEQLPDLIDRSQTFLLSHGILTHRVTLEEAVRGAPASPATVGKAAATAVTWTITTILSVVTVLILTFYLLVESDTLLKTLLRLFPKQNRLRVYEATRTITAKVSAWLAGQLVLAGTIGTTAAVALYLFGVPYFYVLALVAAIGELIPIVGPLLSAIPAILAALAVSPKTALFVALFWIVQQQIENHLLVPKIMQRQVGVSPVIVIIALLVGGSLLGAIGAILAVPTAAIVLVVVQELLDDRDATTT